ncbi:hypothetical protein [Teichococcus oryzae]|uniref:Peptidase C39 domain-containing protein n=1 Tax=Teichococcus oryzae TaxID=1608942 RepID=A0A5B2TIZ3_9PROT|nr:hypothetical protein [Pseudoroseomonas oryzae]KAA2213898.1 hypothetical protein F0Q34_07555 [Pseudoroseomonas oryzae]
MDATTPDLPSQEAGRRGAEALAAERGGVLPWCGPACIALAADCSYAIACTLLRTVAPERYAPDAEIDTTYWRDMVAALDHAGVPATPLSVEGRPTLLRLVRQGTMEPGFYLVRVTGHFLLLRLHGFGLAEVHDNRLSGAVLSTRTHGLCRVTHLARLGG